MHATTMVFFVGMPISGIGRWSKRRDLAALVVLLVFGAFANAALMTGPVMDWRERLSDALGLKSPLLATTLVSLIVMVAAPLLVGGAAALCRWWGRSAQNWSEVTARYSFALVPLGFAMWLTHYSFHFVTSYASVVPTTQRFAADLGGSLLGDPEWSCACCLPTADWLHLPEAGAWRIEVIVGDGLQRGAPICFDVVVASPPLPWLDLAPWIGWALLAIGLFVFHQWLVHRRRPSFGQE